MFLFFDIGDTLVDEADFARFRHASVHQFFRERGCAISDAQYRADLNNLSMQGRMTLFDQLRWLAERNGCGYLMGMAVFRDYILRVAPEAPGRFRPFADAHATLAALAGERDGDGRAYRLGVIANQPVWIRGRLREWKLLGYFEEECVIISDEVAISKPRPEIFQFALEQARVEPEEAVMIGNDYAFDIEPAKRLGMRTVWIEREDPYAPGAPPIAHPVAADERIAELAELPDVLARLSAPASLANGRAPQRTRTGRKKRA
ncbi:MAG: hypothetical protein OJF49_000891 [Ktedonobacterales bacterium]|jgi:FMN phosphatase YigB (HAD superfamily)|nr:MAG: hypothetical protein OJF49_000891 [Ktedonobacterales bacterium]